MVVGAIYQLSDGMITVFCNGPDEEFLHLQTMGDPNLAVYVGEIDMKTHYLPGGVPTERPEMPLEFALSGTPLMVLTGEFNMRLDEVLEVSGIPEGCAVFHPAGRDIVDDGFIEWEAAQPTEFTFMFVCAPYREVKINAKVA